MLNNLLDDLIPKQQPAKAQGVSSSPDGLLDDLIQNTATPPQSQALVPPAVAVTPPCATQPIQHRRCDKCGKVHAKGVGKGNANLSAVAFHCSFFWEWWKVK